MTIERRLGRITDYFLAAGTVTAADAVRLRIARPERVRSIAPPIDVDIPAISRAERCEARALLGVPADARVIGTTARLDAQKAPLDMVAAFAALEQPDLHMVWLGDGELRAKTERLIEREESAIGSTSSAAGRTCRSCFRPSTSSRCRACARACHARSPRR